MLRLISTFVLSFLMLLSVLSSQAQTLSFDIPSISDQQVTAGHVFRLQLPEATGDPGPFTYNAFGVPFGVSFNTTTRMLSGSVDNTGTSSITYRATKPSTSEFVEEQFQLIVNAAVSIGGTVSDQSYTKDAQITDLVLPAATGGTGTLTYTLSPALPTGLTFTASTRTISGTPTAQKSQTQYTLTATDENSATGTKTFNITVNAAVSISGSISNQSYTKDQQITDLVLPAATGGTGTLTYTLSPALPDGLTFTASTRTISGTPTESKSQTQYTVTATDANGATGTKTFNITVDIQNLSLGTLTNQGYTKSLRITNYVIPTTGGFPQLSFSIVPSLPRGLSLNTSTGTISGTPTLATPSTQHTITVTDGVVTVSKTFTITVNDAMVLGWLQGAYYWTQNSLIPDRVLPAVTGGTAPITYSLTPALPNGVTFNASTRTISGTPTSGMPPEDYTYTATDANGATVSKVTSISVGGQRSFSLGYLSNKEVTKGHPFTIQLPAATGDPGPFTYSASGYPQTVSLNASTRQITGTINTVGTVSVAYWANKDGTNETVNRSFQLRTNPSVGLYAIDQEYRKDRAIQDYVIPAATGGTGTITYTLSPALPTGLSFNASTRTISGTPTVAQAKTQYTVTATDAIGASSTAEFHITVEALSIGSVSDQSYTRNRQITDLVISAATGGTGTITYTLSPALPTGLSFNASTRTISGTPTRTKGKTQYTVTATGSGNSTGYTTFNITVNAALSLGTVSNQTYSKELQITDLVLPAASGGTGSITYSLSPSLPAGLSFTASTRTISGTPTSAQTAQTYTYSARDANGATTSKTFTITVEKAISLGTIANQGYTVNSQITPLVLPAASGATPPYTYTLTPALPTGLTFTASTRTISGTASVTKAQTEYTYTATDASGATSSQTFDLTVNTAISLATISDQTFTKDHKITDLVLPEASSGTSPYTYTLTPALPTGLTFTASTRTISGTASVTKAQTEYTYTATDASGATNSQTFDLTVNTALSLATISNQSYTRNQQITDLVLPAVSGGTGTITYSLSSRLPNGLAFTASTRTISGTPIVSQTTKTYTYTATDDNSSTTSQTFTITVDGNVSLATIADQGYTVNRQITDLVLPAPSGGTPPYQYSISPALPTGLTFTSSTRTISGTPTATKVETEYTYEVSDASGGGTSSPVAVQTFNLTVNAAMVHGALSTSYLYAKGFRKADDVLPAVTGGTAPITYSLSPALPSGLSFNAATRTISGTPTATTTQATYTYTATDATGATTSKTSQVRVILPFSCTQPPNQLYYSNHPISEFDGDDYCSEGAGSETWTITPALPAGIVRSGSTMQLSGTPTETITETAYTATGTDLIGTTSSFTFNITVKAGLTVPEVADQSFTKGARIQDLIFPGPSNTVGLVEHGITPVLPTGLSFNQSNRTLSGTPTGVSAQKTYQYQTFDRGNNLRVFRDFEITVNDAPSLTTISNQSYTQNQQITDLVLPAASGGTGTITYTISPSLPGGLMFTASTRTLSGTPTASQSAKTYTYTATDANAVTTSQTFTILVDGLVSIGTIADQDYSVNRQITDLVLPAATGGTTPYTYTLTPSLPTGLTFTASTRTISGTPTVRKVETEYTYEASDANGVKSVQTFNLTVNGAPSLTTISNQSYTQNQQITDLVLPAASGGTGTITYSLSPSLPSGLVFTASTRKISGVPTSLQTAQTYTYTATDVYGATASKTFTITVNAALSLGTISDQEYTQNYQIANLVLPAASGGASPYTYTLTPSLPTGLTFTVATRTISGTASVPKVETEYTYTVTDASGTKTSQTFDLTVNSALSMGTITNQTYTVNQQITDLVLLAASGGTGSITYSLSPSLPGGLTFTASTRTISGTPASSQTTKTYTHTATDVNGATTSQTFTIAVDGPVSLGTIADQDYSVNRQITDLVLPAATGGTTPYTYTLTPSLPTGLTFTASTRTISGMPTVTKVETEYIYKAEDASGISAVQTFNLTVNTAPSLGSVSDQSFTQNHQITDLVLPAVTGGSSPYTYTLTPALPTGLTFTAATHTISGTASVTKAQTEYTYTVTDANGLKDSETFDLTVNAALSLTALSNQIYAQNQQITALVLPVASGGTGSITYSISPSLPAGLSFAAATRTISGTPTSLQNAETYTYTATDANGAAASQTFTIKVSLVSIAEIPDQGYTLNEQITALVLPAASGGTSPYTYVLTPALPTGLSFNATTRTISGTPTLLQSAQTYTYVVTDATGVTASQTFSIAVVGPLSLGTIVNQGYTQNQQITALVLPEAAGGTPPYAYTLTPALPTGLSFDVSTRTISGTPTDLLSTTSYQYEVVDASGNTLSESFTITVSAAEVLALSGIADQVYTFGQVVSFNLSRATGGLTPYQYALSPTDLPAGLSFNSTSVSISGTAQAVAPPRTYTLTVSDAAQQTVTQTFTLEVQMALAAVEDQQYQVGQAISDLVLPQSGGGASPLTYSLSPALPTGLVFNAVTRTISGTPTAGLPVTQYTYTATDGAGLQSTRTFNLEVQLGLSAISAQSFTAGVAIENIVLPAAVGGTLPVTYQLSPGLPSGLSFDMATRTISGTPTSVAEETSYTYTAQDANGAIGSQTFTITITSGALTLGQILDQTFTQNHPIADLVLPVATGATDVSYRLVPQLPRGLQFIPASRTITGTPLASQPATTYTYLAEDTYGASASVTFTITVKDALDVTPIADQIYVQNQQIPEVVLPAATGGLSPYTYTLTPNLPAGLAFDVSTRTISGTPTTVQNKMTYVYQAEDLNGAVATQAFMITVNGILALEATTDQVYTLNQPISDLVLPAATGGIMPYSYNLSGPSLPNGLSFNATTRTLSGTPTEVQAATTYTWQAEDATGTQISSSFTLTVKEALALGSIMNQVYMQDQPITDLVLPAATGGTAPYTYRFVGDPLPSGLSFTAATRTISGTPTVVQPTITYTWEAGDSDGVKVSTTFDLTVESALVLASIPNQVYTQNLPITSLPLPAASGGRAPYTYEISPALPSGLTFDPGSRTLTGTPTTASTKTAYTYTVTDALDFKGSQSFNITVFPAGSEVLKVLGNYPNPSRGESTKLEVSLTRDSDVRLEVFNILGKRVIDQKISQMKAGENQQIAIEWRGVGAGLYLYRITANAAQQTEMKVGRVIRID